MTGWPPGPPAAASTRRPPSVLHSGVQTSDLALLVPELMPRHPNHRWTLVSGHAPGEDLVLTLHPDEWPDRVATVKVHVGAEVFSLSFAGHESVDFAYEDADRPDALQARIDLAVAATTGPTRVVRDCAGDLTVRSTLVVDPDGPHPREDQVVSYPLRRARALFTGRRVTRVVKDFPAAPTR